MKEIKDIVEAYNKAHVQGRQTALATVVHVAGSSYRRAGARMLIEDNGQLTGAISGGCLEGDALRKALLVMHEQRSMLVTYDTMDDDDAKFGVGLGCNGIIQVLIEPIISTKENNPIALLKAIAQDRINAILVTIFSIADKKNTQPGTCIMQKENGVGLLNIVDPRITHQLNVDIEESLHSKNTSFKNYISNELNVTAFIEFVPPPVSVIIAGAGNDVIPLVDMINVLGWEATVIDGRQAYAKAERFASGCNIKILNAENIVENIVIDDHTAFLLMTHNYNYDYTLLKALLPQNAAYVGILGPKKKWERIAAELAEENIILTNEQIVSIHSPVGLDIGAETPEEIALSILAEIKAFFSKRNGSQLKKKASPIHHHEDGIIEQIKI